MPFEPTATALNLPQVQLDEARAHLGDPPSSICLVASERLRVVLLSLPLGIRPAHVHPHEDEVIQVVSGTLEATLADGHNRVVGPGAVLFAPRGTRHQVRVPGPEPALLLCSVAPNVDAAEVVSPDLV